MTNSVIYDIFEAGLYFNPRRSGRPTLIITPDMQWASVGARYARIDYPRYARLEVQVLHQNTKQISLIVITQGY